MDNLERIFAAEVHRGASDAAVCEAHGINQADLIEGALADLWERGFALGHDRDEIQAIADRHVPGCALKGRTV